MAGESGGGGEVSEISGAGLSWTRFEERQKVHALVLGLLEQRVNPAAVASHQAEGAKMAKDAGGEAWYAGDGLEL